MSAYGDLGNAQRTRRGRAAAGQDGWLTAILRPAGPLDQAAASRLAGMLGHLAASSDMVVVDLTATEVINPRTLASSLRAPALESERMGRCLLLVGASAGLTAELDRIAVPAISLAADAMPARAS